MSDHKHELTTCNDCDGTGYKSPDHEVLCYCDGRGYIEVCRICGEPMGNERRWWKRERQSQSGEPHRD